MKQFGRFLELFIGLAHVVAATAGDIPQFNPPQTILFSECNRIGLNGGSLVRNTTKSAHGRSVSWLSRPA